MSLRPNQKTATLADFAEAAIAEWREIVDECETPAGLDAAGSRLLKWHVEILGALCERIDARFDVVAIGDLALGELAPGSPVEVLLFTASLETVDQAESQAGEWLSILDSLKRMGVALDLQAREWTDRATPAIVRSYEGFRLYQIASITMFERYEFGAARLIYGREAARTRVIEAAYGQPLTPERLDHLLRLKRQIETEKVSQKHARRDVNLGIGGLTDIEWMVRLHEMRFPTATAAENESTLEDRIWSLGAARLLNALETETLADARRRLSNVRTRIARLGFTPNILPENPDKLDRIGHSFGFPDGNAFLADHEAVIESVRAIYNEGIERLRA